MEFLLQAAEKNIEGANHSVQVLLSTHSPNLASKIPLANLILLQGGRAFPLADNETLLESGDYRFLERFLDVTKANLFFAHGVLIVEGDAEAILLPVVAKLIGNDLTEHGVSIVNVGGEGLRRFSRIFQRKDQGVPTIGVPVASLTDIDVLPDCAPKILGLVEDEDDVKWQSSKRRWKAVRDFGDNAEQRDKAMAELRDRLKENEGQSVRTFVADHWTFEYDLARCGLAEQVYIAASLAKNDVPLNEDKKSPEEVTTRAKAEFTTLKLESGDDDAVLCSRIYRLYHSGSASKAVAAQYLSEILPQYCEECSINAAGLRRLLPAYLVNAIDYLTTYPHQTSETASIEGGENG